MKAFISYSIVDDEQYLITLLSNKLRGDGYTLVTSTNLYGNTLDFTTTQQISTSQLFIGIVSYNGQQRNRVLKEWQNAVNNRIPSVLLIEQNLRIEAGTDPSTYIRFNRNNPQPAIDEIQKRMSSKKPIEDETTGWVLAGAALLALIALFSSSKK
jgi:hypothetical protein